MIRLLYSPQQIQAYLNSQIDRLEEAIIAILARRGEQFVSSCRNQQTWVDDTGNLRSSIGYCIYKANEALVESFSGDEEGQIAAREAIDAYDKEPNNYYLILVAGMNYAAAVESKGYNVISNQVLMIAPLISGDLDNLAQRFR